MNERKNIYEKKEVKISVLESNYFSTEDVLANGKIDYLYHMSHINNLADILKRELYCHNYSHEHLLVKKYCGF